MQDFDPPGYAFEKFDTLQSLLIQDLFLFLRLRIPTSVHQQCLKVHKAMEHGQQLKLSLNFFDDSFKKKIVIHWLLMYQNKQTKKFHPLPVFIGEISQGSNCSPIMKVICGLFLNHFCTILHFLSCECFVVTGREIREIHQDREMSLSAIKRKNMYSVLLSINSHVAF